VSPSPLDATCVSEKPAPIETNGQPQIAASALQQRGIRARASTVLGRNWYFRLLLKAEGSHVIVGSRLLRHD
jgi:hypothetical protein